MNAKLTPGVILIGVLLGTMIGPFTTLKDIATDPGQIASTHYWMFVGAQTIGSFATSALTGIGILGASMGLPMWQQRNVPPPAEPPVA